MFSAVELSPGQGTLFDKVYLEQMAALGMSPRPMIEKIDDPKRFGLFRLEVSVSWKNTKGYSRRVSYSRLCYAP